MLPLLLYRIVFLILSVAVNKEKEMIIIVELNFFVCVWESLQSFVKVQELVLVKFTYSL